MKKYMIYFLLFLLPRILLADVQKNKIVQNAMTKKSTDRLGFDASLLIRDQHAFKTAVDIFYDRYKTEKIDGFLSLNNHTLPIASCLGYLMGVPVYPLNLCAPFFDKNIQEKERFILITDILTDGIFQKSVIEWVEEKSAFIMEICCLTEDLSFKGRENIPAQVMSIFLLKNKTVLNNKK